ncbi:hypothetical protein [Verrucomicrobium spinosum]|uniref:hypothetical protein n=1 Tax=Verrucomicrobium spinosum TaxID=2736 RepID=UPI0001746670|nr:hypothetical protein [Verrucomicrobium spinosum]
MSLKGIAQAVAAARNRHQDAREETYPGTAWIGGNPYVCTVTQGARQQVQNEDGNWVWQNILYVAIRKSLLLNPPAVRSLVTVDGTVYRLIRTAGLRTVNVAWELVCGRFGD